MGSSEDGRVFEHKDTGIPLSPQITFSPLKGASDGQTTPYIEVLLLFFSCFLFNNVAQAGSKGEILQPQAPECWGYRYVCTTTPGVTEYQWLI